MRTRDRQCRGRGRPSGCAVIPGLHNCSPALGPASRHGRVDVAVGLAARSTWTRPTERSHPRSPRPRRCSCYAERSCRHDVGDGHVALHGGLGPGGARPVGIRATLVPYVADEEGLLLLRVDGVQPPAPRGATARRRRSGARVGRSRAPVLLHARSVRGRVALADEFDTGIHTHSSETIWEVQESLPALRLPPDRGVRRLGALGRARSSRTVCGSTIARSSCSPGPVLLWLTAPART